MMAKTQMLINYVPGDECRVAIVEDGKLEEYHAESTRRISRVNNIYVGRVKNVESAIQAAFVDFGIGEAGFLHVSDIHPSYFPGEDGETKERVGKKTPRRERPPIQQCLKKGQEIVVQVLKEGVGTKGPTVTGYLSIPGRFLVMMPQMDRVGVSRKVEDEEQRKKMREILSQLDLPEGFGFILRTAGFDRTKTELKRDLAYLLRLWKDMEKRRASGSGPRLLYSESDLLVRALRDWMTSDIEQVVIDDPQALARAARFMKIVAPRASAKLMRYTGRTPIFHAFGIEEQILSMHAREVPLPSGGRLVIDETEALVAIDVNSGRSRSARDAETNAFQTNMEAADEICRQLRLRDLGGLVINDLIDMRSSANRKKVEARFRERLKRDRARSTILPISNFGILEMTRQRQRASHERTHFAECPTCHGRGLVQKAASVAGDALRELGCVLAHEAVAKAELVVSARLAGELLSTRRNSITRLERAMGKHIDVRVSEAMPLDRFTVYAYDAQGTDLKLEKLRRKKITPALEPWDKAGDAWAVEPEEEAPPELPDEAPEEPPLPGEDVEPATKKKRRRRRRKRKEAGEGDRTDRSTQGTPDDGGASSDGKTAPSDDGAAVGGEPETAPENGAAQSTPESKPKRRRRRRGKKKTAGEKASVSETATNNTTEPESPPASADDASPPESESPSSDAAPATKKKRRRKRTSKKKAADTKSAPKASAEREPVEPAPATNAKAGGDEVTIKPVRSLYGASRRRLSPAERARLSTDR